MKNLIIALIILAPFATRCQSLNLMAGAERSVKGTDVGVAFGFENKRHWSLGCFYQSKLDPATTERNGLTDPFYGIYTQIPLAASQKLLFSFNLRTGFVNEKFFIVTPSLETTVMARKRIGAVFAMGFRNGYPSASVRLVTKLF